MGSTIGATNGWDFAGILAVQAVVVIGLLISNRVRLNQASRRVDHAMTKVEEIHQATKSPNGSSGPEMQYETLKMVTDLAAQIGASREEARQARAAAQAAQDAAEQQGTLLESHASEAMAMITTMDQTIQTLAAESTEHLLDDEFRFGAFAGAVGLDPEIVRSGARKRVPPPHS